MNSASSPGGSLAPSSRFAPAPRIVSERAGDEWFLLDPTTGRTFRMAGVAAFAWERFDGRRSLAELAEEVAATFDVDRETAAADLGAFASDLLGSGLLRAVGDAE